LKRRENRHPFLALRKGRGLYFMLRERGGWKKGKRRPPLSSPKVPEASPPAPEDRTKSKRDKKKGGRRSVVHSPKER